MLPTRQPTTHSCAVSLLQSPGLQSNETTHAVRNNGQVDGSGKTDAWKTARPAGFAVAEGNRELSNDNPKVTVPFYMEKSEVTFDSSDNTERKISIRVDQLELPLAWNGSEATVGKPGSILIYQSTVPLTLKFSRNELGYNISWENESWQHNWTNDANEAHSYLTIILKPGGRPVVITSPQLMPLHPSTTIQGPYYSQDMSGTTAGLMIALLVTLVILVLNAAVLVNIVREQKVLKQNYLELVKKKKSKDKARKKVEEKAPIPPTRPNLLNIANGKPEGRVSASYITPIDVKPVEIAIMQKENTLISNVCHVTTPKDSISKSLSMSRQAECHNSPNPSKPNTVTPTYEKADGLPEEEDLYLSVEGSPP